MKTVAYLTSADMVPGLPGGRDDLFELELQLAQLFTAAREVGFELVLSVWDDPRTLARVEAGEVDAVVVGTPWDYQDHPRAFLSTIDRFEARVPVLNPAAVLRWNAHKSYLRDLEQAGVRVVPTLWADRVDGASVAMAHAELGDFLVAKPIIGACAVRQVRLTHGDPLPAPHLLPPAGALIQPFVPAIQTEGELSFVYCGGVLSHALVKRPRSGDYRVQSVYGGVEAVYAPTAAERAVADSVLAAVPGDDPLLYARVDLVRAADGGLMVMELELIEPYLYPEQGPELGAHYARALSALLPG